MAACMAATFIKITKPFTKGPHISNLGDTLYSGEGN